MKKSRIVTKPSRWRTLPMRSFNPFQDSCVGLLCLERCIRIHRANYGTFISSPAFVLSECLILSLYLAAHAHAFKQEAIVNGTTAVHLLFEYAVLAS